MKKIAFLSILLFLIQFAQAQETSPADVKVYDTKEVDVQPIFPRGMEAFYDFFDINFTPPNVPSLIGKIFLSFIVEKDGTLTDIKVVKDIGFGAGIEAMRVLNTSPEWVPGKKDGKKVRVLYMLPIGIVTK